MEISKTAAKTGNSPIDEKPVTLTQSSEIYPEVNNITDARVLMKLPIEERRRILAEQAEAMLLHYQQNKEWQELQTWDLIDD